MIPLPAQPADVPWPTEGWPEARPDVSVDIDRLEAALQYAFRDPSPEAIGETHALLAVHRGAIVAERYATGHDRDTTLPSWSMAKSITHALVGILVREGRLDVSARADVPEWQDPSDPRHAITIDQLLRMSSGLRFFEDYVDAETSDCIQMLFGSGQEDTAHFAASFPLDHPAGRFFSYSSGTTNIVARLLSRIAGGGKEEFLAFFRRELLDRIGMRQAVPRFDAAGTFIGSSFVFAPARDFARLGLLYLRDGLWDGEQVLPEGWVDYARTPTPTDPERSYGAHWWLSLDGSGHFSANGYRGQYTVCVPERDLVVVRLGGSTPEQRGGVYRNVAEVVRSFPLLQP